MNDCIGYRQPELLHCDRQNNVLYVSSHWGCVAWWMVELYKVTTKWNLFVCQTFLNLVLCKWDDHTHNHPVKEQRLLGNLIIQYIFLPLLRWPVCSFVACKFIFPLFFAALWITLQCIQHFLLYHFISVKIVIYHFHGYSLIVHKTIIHRNIS